MKNGLKYLESLALALALPAAGWAQSGPLPIKFGGQFRLRYEATSLEGNAPLKRRTADATSLRTRLSADVAAVEGISAFLQIQDSRTSGSEVSTVSNDGLVDMHQAYLDVAKLFGYGLDLRAGRQELAYGDSRLVGNLDWSNVGRSFDGARLRYGAATWKADLFLTRVKDVAGPRKDQVFSGFYGTCSAVKDHEFDAYLLSREYGDDSQLSEAGGAGNLSEKTLGYRGKGRMGLLDYSAEAAHQFGRKATDKINAHALALTGGINPLWAYKPRFGVEYDYASGDSDPTDNKSGAFDPLFPTGHLYQGYADIVGWRNIHDIIATASAEPVEGTRVQLDFHSLRLAQAKDSWVDKAGTAIARDAAGGSGRDLGTELDLHVKTTFRKSLKLWLGYSRFFKGSYVANTIGGRNKDWAFVQAILNF